MFGAAAVNPTYGYSELPVSSWPDAKAILRKFPISWIFRGQADADWPLATTLERMAPIPFGAFSEDIVTSEFQSQARNYLEAQHLPAELLEWWALMQHHGAPTRLLDWTESAYVAAFFALDTAERDCCIWAVDRVWCRNSAAGAVDKAVGAEGKVRSEHLLEHFEKIVPANRTMFAVPVRPKTYNSRLAIQQGLFLCPGDAAAPFMANLFAQDAPGEIQHRVVKLVLSHSMRPAAIQDLNYMNINSSTLFPGLDGFARSLRNRANMLREAEDPVDDLAIVNGFPFGQSSGRTDA